MRKGIYFNDINNNKVSPVDKQEFIDYLIDGDFLNNCDFYIVKREFVKQLLIFFKAKTALPEKNIVLSNNEIICYDLRNSVKSFYIDIADYIDILIDDLKLTYSDVESIFIEDNCIEHEMIFERCDKYLDAKASNNPDALMRFEQ